MPWFRALFGDNRLQHLHVPRRIGEKRGGRLTRGGCVEWDMSVPSHGAIGILRRAFLAIALLLSVSGTGYAQRIAPFDRLAGNWSGSGTIELSNGTHESIRCRAAYDVLSGQSKLQLNIRCADYSAGAVSGYWSESTRGVSGTITGRADGDRFQVVARAASFVATLTLLTHGGRQSVSIRSQDSQSTIRSVSVNLRRSG